LKDNIFADAVDLQWAADWSKLGTTKIWRDAISQVIFTLGIGTGPVLYTSNCVTTERIRFEYVVPIVAVIVSLLTIGVFYAYIGPHQDERLKQQTGYEYDFTVFASAIASLDNPKVLEAVFFLLLTLVGLNTLSLTCCMTLNFLVSQFNFLSGHRQLTAVVLLLVYFFFGFIFCTERGLKFIAIWEYYAIGLGPLCLIAVEIFAIFYWN
jgi:SNF family Na+-dependent transporter